MKVANSTAVTGTEIADGMSTITVGTAIGIATATAGVITTTIIAKPQTLG
jgi:hypothetical protein